MVQTYFNGGPIGCTFFLTVGPMMAYKLELLKITPAGMVFRRCSGKMPDKVFVVRPRGVLLRPVQVELTRSDPGKIHCAVTALSGDLLLEKL